MIDCMFWFLYFCYYQCLLLLRLPTGQFVAFMDTKIVEAYVTGGRMRGPEFSRLFRFQ